MSLSVLGQMVSKDHECHILWLLDSGEALIGKCLDEHVWPDVILIDAELGDSSGISLCRRLREVNSSVSVVIITSYPLRRYYYRAIMAGAQGLIHKSDYRYLIPVLHEVHDGSAMSVSTFRDMSEVTGADGITISSQESGDDDRPPAPQEWFKSASDSYDMRHSRKYKDKSCLNYMEEMVLRLSAEGMTQNDIAREIGISSTSVRTYSLRARRKLKSKTLIQAVVTWLSINS
ncbi:response regulator transcription factor [Bifidobacterium callitrichos]|uniref:Response regulator transcription factor n=3 Tax=Bifidobacterium callitrichos TaxID=762209 RepID=A0A5M9ZF19_9BIFI|nr:response regulator transcription factor [Bifidobacterium callitrichos]